MRLKTKPTGPTSPGKDADVAALAGELAKAGADAITKEEHLSDDLRQRLEAAIKTHQHLADRWAGMVDDLTEAGRDSSRSSLDLSLAALLKRAGFDHLDTGLILCAFAHGKANGDPWTGNLRLRHVARCVLRSHNPKQTPGGDDKIEWGKPLDFIADQETAPPELREEHIPAPLWPFIQDTAERMGVDKTSVALSSIVSCATVITDDWLIQPKCYDYTWVESARLWSVILGPPSILKTPVLRACIKPIETIEIAERERYKSAMRAYKTELAEWKRAEKSGGNTSPEPIRPLLARYIIMDATVESISEVLRDDDEATQYAPAKKVLSFQDEMSEFFAGMDRYRSGSKGGVDRGAWNRLYNGGRNPIDRIGRGAFSVPNWSACSLGGCQPGPIQAIAKDAVDDGLLQRNLYAVPGPQRPGLDRKPNQDALNRYHALFPALVGLLPRRNEHGYPYHVVLHEDAHQHREYIDNLADAMAAMPDASTRLRSSYGKWAGMFARLCLTFHMINIADCRARGETPPHLEVVPEETACCVARFMRDIVLPHLLRADALMYRTTQTGHAKWIAGHILAHKLAVITTRDITRVYRDLRDPESRRTLSDTMQALVLFGWCEPVQPKNPLNPVSSWLVNPEVHSLYAAQGDAERAARQQTREAIAATIEELKKKSGI